MPQMPYSPSPLPMPFACMPSLPKLFARMANSPLACMNQPFGRDVLATGPGVDGSLPSQFPVRHFQCHAGAAMFVCANANTVVPTPLPPSFVHTAKANSPALLSPPLTLPVGASRSGWAPLAKLSVAYPLHWPFPRGRVLLVGGSSGLDAHLMAGLHPGASSSNLCFCWCPGEEAATAREQPARPRALPRHPFAHFIASSIFPSIFADFHKLQKKGNSSSTRMDRSEFSNYSLASRSRTPRRKVRICCPKRAINIFE